MIYGNKLVILVLLLSFFLIVGCDSHKNFSYKLYDNYEIIKMIRL